MTVVFKESLNPTLQLNCEKRRNAFIYPNHCRFKTIFILPWLIFKCVILKGSYKNKCELSVCEYLQYSANAIRLK